MAAKLETLTTRLADVAEHYDTHSCWPQRSLDIITDAGAWKWAIPRAFGGSGFSGAKLLEAYEAVAAGCMSTALILTQRDGACDLIANGENDELKKKLLPAYAKAQRFTSIGIAQLTTSKGAGGRKPPMQAKRAGRAFVLDGVMPWVTGAEQCDEIVTGAELPDGRQILACVNCDDPGVTIEPAMQLMALGASRTSRVRCKAVRVSKDELVRSPSDFAMSMRAPVKPLVVSGVGIGLAGALQQRLNKGRLPAETRAAIRPLKKAHETVRAELFEAAKKVARNGDVDARGIRVKVNELVVKQAIAFLTLSKGTGYCHPHPAERLLREAMLFLVWSAPQEVQAQTLRATVGDGLNALA